MSVTIRNVRNADIDTLVDLLDQSSGLEADFIVDLDTSYCVSDAAISTRAAVDMFGYTNGRDLPPKR